MKFSTIALISLVNMAAVDARVLSEDSVLTACTCDDSNRCTDLPEDEDTTKRVCFRPTNETFLMSIESLSLQQGDQNLDILPSAGIEADCEEDGTLCVIDDVPFPMEFVNGGDSILARGMVILGNETSLDGDASEDGDLDLVSFETRLETESPYESPVKVKTLALISGVAVLLQTTYFLVRHNYRQAQAGLPI